MAIGIRQMLRSIAGSLMGLDDQGALVINKKNGGQLVVDGSYAISLSRNLLPSDNGKTLEITTSLTLTAVSKLPKDFTCLFLVPASGTTLTLASDGTAQLNGATASITCAGSSSNKFSMIGLASAADSYVV